MPILLAAVITAAALSAGAQVPERSKALRLEHYTSVDAEARFHTRPGAPAGPTLLKKPGYPDQ